MTRFIQVTTLKGKLQIGDMTRRNTLFFSCRRSRVPRNTLRSDRRIFEDSMGYSVKGYPNRYIKSSKIRPLTSERGPPTSAVIRQWLGPKGANGTDSGADKVQSVDF